MSRPLLPPCPADAADRMLALAGRLYPICRSITGDGVRQSLDILGERLPLARHEVPSGARVLDWTVPREWVVRGAWIRDPSGRTVVDFADHNLHLVNYSAPVRARLPLSALRPHLHSLPDRPDLIPYKTTYYRETWGFCLPDLLLRSLPEGEYEVCVDTELRDGALSYAELLLPGRSERELLLSTHVCHPSLANDNLSGIAVAAELASLLLSKRESNGRMPLPFSIRFLFIPGTLGSIAWLARNREATRRVFAGLTLTCLGDAGGFTYKRSRRGNARIDRVLARRLAASGAPHRIIDFFPYGYDERQFCSPGFNLPVGCLMRTPHGEFPEYHTSADNLALLRPESLLGSLELLRSAVEALAGEPLYRNLAPEGEPQLGPRGLYTAPGPEAMALLWVLNLCDGDHSLPDIAERSGLDPDTVRAAADRLAAAGLLEREA